MKIIATCEKGHKTELNLPGYTREAAEQLAGLMDGTSDLYLIKPRDKPIEGGTIGKCDWPTDSYPDIRNKMTVTMKCGAWFNCRVED